MKKKYSTIEAVLHNSLIKHLKSLEFKINNTICSLHYLPESPTFKSLISLKLELLNKIAIVDFSHLSFLSLHADTKDIKNYKALPQELQQALAQYIFEDLLKNFSQLLNTPISFLPTSNDEDLQGIKKSLYPFSFTFSVDSLQIPVVFYLPKECIEQILPLLTKLPAEKSNFSNTILPCSIEVGSTELSLEELRDLEEGDVLLVDSLSHLSEEKTALFFPIGVNAFNNLPAFICTLEKSTLTFTQTYRLTQEISMSEEVTNQNQENITEINEQESPPTIAETAAVEQKAPAHFNDIKVRVSFELERRNMTIEELENLSVGTNMLLESDPEQPVTLVISDTAFAKARIIEIEGRYGLQLTEILVKKD